MPVPVFFIVKEGCGLVSGLFGIVGVVMGDREEWCLCGGGQAGERQADRDRQWEGEKRTENEKQANRREAL